MTPQFEKPPCSNHRNAASADFGPMERWKDLRITRPGGDQEITGKFWLKDLLALTGVEVSLNSMPRGGAMPFSHSHDQNEELYIFLSGAGQMQIDGEVIEVRAGSVVRVDPAAVRCWRNTGETDLWHIVIQSKADSLEQWTRTDGRIAEAAPTWG